MPLYFLEYDLRGTRDYEMLYDKLAELGAKRILESTWCFNRVNTSAERLRDYFGQFVDGNDGLCVTEVKDWATRGTDGNPNQL